MSEAVDTFDPSSAPRFPVLTLEVRSGQDGPEVWFDGERQEVPGEAPTSLDDDRLYSAGITAAAGRAEERPGTPKCIRVLALHPDHEAEELVVLGDGSVHAASERDKGATEGSSQWARLSRPRKIVVAAALSVAMLAAGGLVGVTVLSEKEPVVAAPAAGPPTPSPTLLPVLGPTGEVMTAEWSSAPLRGERVPVLWTQSAVVTIAKSGDLVGIDGATGHEIWRRPLQGSGTSTSLTRAAGDAPPDRVTAITSAVVEQVDGRTGQVVQSLELGQGQDAHAVPGGVVVRTSAVAASILDAQGQWVSRVIPPGAEPVAQVGDALVSLSPSGQVWSTVSSSVPPSPLQLPSPARGAVARGVLGASEAGLLFAWTTSDGVAQLVQHYDWTNLSRAVRTVRAGQAGQGEPRPSSIAFGEDGWWFIVDRDLVDLKTGKVTALPNDWRTEVALSDVAFASPSRGVLRMVSRDGEVQTFPAASGEVAAPVAQQRAVALVRSSGDDVAARLYAVRLPSFGAPAREPK